MNNSGASYLFLNDQKLPILTKKRKDFSQCI